MAKLPLCFRHAAVALSLLGSLWSGCGDEDSSANQPSPEAVAGTAAFFDLDADLTSPESFYSVPYPSDLRLDSNGRTDHTGFPGNGNRALRPIVASASERRLSPVTPFAYFRFDAPLAPRSAEDWIAASPQGPVLLIGISEHTRDYGKLLPTIASTLPPDAYVPEHLLAVSVPAGVVLAPNSTYAFVLLRSLGDDRGQPLGVGESFARLRAGMIPPGTLGERAASTYEPLWQALRAADVPLAEVAAATVFSTGDVVADLARLSASIRARYPIQIESLHVDPDDGAQHPRFCELRGEARVPLFQRGQPPYNGDGRFEFDTDGLPVVQAEQRVPLTITLPRSPMPAGGFPLTLYFHGTGGLSDQVVDRGPVREPGGERAKGEGPAHVLAAHGIATFAAALPLNPERYQGPVGVTERSYLNLNNLGAYPDTFRQMAIEQQLFLDALSSLSIEAGAAAACDLPAPTAGSFHLRTDRVFALGQSLGGQITNMFGALEPRVAAVVPTGSGGHWSMTIVSAEFSPGVPAAPLVALLLNVPELRDHLHPALQLVQSVFEPAEPLVYAARLARDPLLGHPARSIYQPVGIDDPGFPNPIYAAMALATGTQQAGDDLDPSMQQALALAGRDGVQPYPVRANARSTDGTRYTGVAVQYHGDGLVDPHHIFAQLDAVKYQYGCFLSSLIEGGPGTVPEPAILGTACELPAR